MTIEATTTIDFETYRKYYLFNFLQGNRSPWQAILLLALSPVLAVTFLVLYLLNPTDLVNLIGFAIMLVMGLILLMIITLVPARYFKSVEKLITIPNRYAFEESQVAITLMDTPTGGRTDFKYETIYKIYETGEAFYIFLRRHQSCIVGRQDFTSGSAADLHHLLTEKLGDRFVVTRSARKLYRK